MPACFAPFCKSGYRGRKGRSFRPHPSVTQEWVKILAKVRTDETFDPSKRHHCLCDLHFDESVIISEDVFKVKGDTVVIPRLRWKLSDGAVPTIFPHQSNFKRTLPKELKQPSIIRTQSSQIKSIVADFQKSYSKNDWNLLALSTPRLTVLTKNDSLGKEKKILIHEDGSFKAEFHNEDVTNIMLNTKGTLDQKTVLRTIKETKHIRVLLDLFDTIKYCDGISGFDKIETLSNGVKIEDRWHSKICQKAGFFDICTPCNLLLPFLERKERSIIPSITEKPNTLQNCEGISGYHKIETMRRGVKLNDKWYSLECQKSGFFRICVPCKLLVPNLQRQLDRSKVKITKKPKEPAMVKCSQAKRIRFDKSNLSAS